MIIFLHKFAFTHRGQVKVSASNVLVTSSSLCGPDPSASGVFLPLEEALPQALLEVERNTNFCILDSGYIITLFTFCDLSPLPSFFNGTYPITYPGVYSLFFANCYSETHVSMNVHTEFYNLDSDGSKNYLSDGQSRLIPLFFEFSLAYFFLLVLWAYYCYCNKESMNRVHLLITGLITTKMLSLICAGLDKYFVKLTGTTHGWEIMFEVARVMSSLIIIALIIIGFSFFKPFLQKKEAKAIIVAIAPQVLPSVVLPFAMTMTWPNEVLLLSWLHLICVCTILLMTGRSHWSPRKAVKIDKKAATSSAKINKFAWLYILAMAYLYEIPVLADSLRIVMAYENRWVSNVMEEDANLTIFVVSLCMFRHVNEYTIIDAQDEKEETMAAANEESGVLKERRQLKLKPGPKNLFLSKNPYFLYGDKTGCGESFLCIDVV